MLEIAKMSNFIRCYQSITLLGTWLKAVKIPTYILGAGTNRAFDYGRSVLHKSRVESTIKNKN